MATQLQKTEKTRQRLLQAAFTLLQTETVADLTANKITQAAGISKGGFFHHFPQIEEFYLYMLDAILQSFEAEMVQQKSSNLEDFLQSSVEFTFEMIDNTPELFAAIYSFIDQARLKPNYAGKVKAILESGLQKWTIDLAQYFPAGFSRKRQEAIIYLIDIYFAGLGTHYLILNNKERYRAITSEFITMLTNHIKGAES